MEKKHFVKIVASLVTVLLKMTLRLFIYFAFTKKHYFKGNAQLIFLCNPQKSSLHDYLIKILKKHYHKNVTVCFYNLGEESICNSICVSSSFCNISNFHNGFV